MSEPQTAQALLKEFRQAIVDCETYLAQVKERFGPEQHAYRQHRDYFWNYLPPDLQQNCAVLTERVMKITGALAPMVRNCPLAGEEDQRDIAIATKAIRATLRLRHFYFKDVEVVHDEGIVHGLIPASRDEDGPLVPQAANHQLLKWVEKLESVFELVVAAAPLARPSFESGSTGSSRYRPGTAFIMMWMDKKNAALDDVCDAVKTVFGGFDITAIRADDIEHEDLITKRILDEIATSEFLFADLTGARPSVYYEIGYAHALGKRVMLYRQKGTGIHFDLAGHNCPEYENLRELKELLSKRLLSITGKEPRSEQA